MASKIRLDISVPVSSATVKARLRLMAGLCPDVITRVGNYIVSMACVLSGRINVVTGAVQAFGTATFSTVVATNSVSVAGVTFTGTNGTPGSTGFKTGTTDELAAVSLAAAINANTTTNKYVVASAAAKVVTMTAIVPGVIGNLVTLTASGVPVTVTGSGFLTSGAEDASVVVYNGI